MIENLHVSEKYSIFAGDFGKHGYTPNKIRYQWTKLFYRIKFGNNERNFFIE